jgi:hypothetical protein
MVGDWFRHVKVKSFPPFLAAAAPIYWGMMAIV